MEKELLENINTELDKLIQEYDGKDNQHTLIAWGLKIAKEKINYEAHIYELVKDIEKYKK